MNTENVVTYEDFVTHEDFVSYEDAKIINKLGFDWDTDYMYLTFDNIIYRLVIDEVDGAALDKIADKGSVYKCPTLAQAQKWLRKEKNHHVDSSCIDKDIWYYTISELIDNVVVLRNDLEFSSYEEALSAGITECLKILGKNI